MSLLKNIGIVAFRFCWNKTVGSIRSTFRFEFDVKRILEKTFPPGSDFHFIQVGAHDGISHDFLYFFVKVRNSSGLVIEPLQDLYDRLKSNYAYNNRIIAVPLAVHASMEKVMLHRVDPKKEHLLPGWAGGIASLNHTHHQLSHIPDEYMIAEEVSAATLSRILQQYNCSTTDFLQIDAEGYDLEVLKMAHLPQLRPRLVRLEVGSLRAHEKEEARAILKAHGYYCFLQTPDMIGIRLNKVVL